MSILYPNMRREVLNAFDVLADRTYQSAYWHRLARAPTPGKETYLIALHALYDDTLVADNAPAMVGIVFRTEEEAAAGSDVVAALDIVSDRYGEDVYGEVHIQQPEWGQVVEAATRALRVCVEDP